MLRRASFATAFLLRHFARSPLSSGQSAAMERCVVRCVAGETHLTISFSLDGSNKQMMRDRTEPLGKVLARISNNVIKALLKDKKKCRHAAPAELEAPEVRLCSDGGEPVPPDTVNAEAWLDGAVLHVGARQYQVERNPPTFTACALPLSLMSGFPVCPKLEVEFGRLEDCEFLWLKQSADGWAETGSGRVFTPTNLDIGLRVMLRCSPRDGSRRGESRELVSEGVVEAGPGRCTFDTRHAFTREETGEASLRVVSYNILADVYAQTELSRSVLYPYCPPYALETDYRQNLLRKELLGYRADLLCLQEVDRGVFWDGLSPALDAFGLQGLFREKEGQHEGVATFFRSSRLKLLERCDVVLGHALASDPLHRALWEVVSRNAALREKIEKRSTALQVSVLQSLSDPSKLLVVGNTHLYYHPKGGNVRLVQMGVALQHLRGVVERRHPGACLILAGDFNSTPSSGPLQLACEGSVSQDHPDWASGGPDQLIRAGLSHTFRLASACGSPAYTNYVGGFQGCLDYIFTEPDVLQVEQVVPLPAHEEVTSCVALPSVSHPSDHIALVCDLRWK